MHTAGSPACPDCGAPLDGSPRRCPACELPLHGPIAAELWQLDLALNDLRGREARLLGRRTELLTALRAAGENQPADAWTAGAQASASSPASGSAETQAGHPGGFAGQPMPPKREMSPSTVRNLLLGLGGLLLVVAAVVFTIVSWGSVGIGGRAAILLGFTALTFAAPFVLVKRGLKATAETLAILGVALFLLDGYAAYQVWFEGRVGALSYTAGLIALAAVVFGVYGPVARLSLPLPVAIGLAQFPLIILSADQTQAHAAGALILTAAIDIALWLSTRQKVALAGLFATWVLGCIVALFRTTGYLDDLSTASTYGALLAVAAVEAGFMALRAKKYPLVPIIGGVLAGVFAVRTPVMVVVPDEWAVVVLPAIAGAFALALRKEARVTALGVGAVSSLIVLVPVAVVLRGPDRGVWSSGLSLGAGDFLSRAEWIPSVPDLVLMVLVTVVLALTVKQRMAAVIAGVVTVAFVPPVFDLPYVYMLMVLLALTVASASVMVASYVWLALAIGVVATVWGLVSETGTLIVLPALALIAGWVAFKDAKLRVWAANVAVIYAGGFAVAVWLSAGQEARFLPFVLLAVAAAAAPWRVTEIGAGVVGLAGLVLVHDLRTFSLAAATAGVIAAGVALRKERGNVAYLATALLLLASWSRLYADDVTLVEAYTAPFSVVLLAFGWWKARSASSWRAYGAGLTFTLLPSLFVLYDQPEGWVRPLALGLVALVVLVVGALKRLQAPAVLGGFTLAAVTVHEIAPWVVDLVLLVPRWVPMAAGGLLLLLVGATYESRIRDVKRVGAAIRGLR
ncbi:SCO7613 C-terminal domain-containing membrane protein [Herbidospora sp. RD11066]